VLFVGMRGMSCPLFSVSIEANRTTQLTPSDLGCNGASRTAQGWIYTVRHSYEHPGELIASKPQPWKPVSISRLPVSTTQPRARVSAVSWPSSDGKFTIPSVLITPEKKPAGKRPLYVSIAGGPNMVTPFVYNGQAQHPVLAALLRDYAVLIPNTRGRGGYGKQFAEAIADEQSFIAGGFSDVMAGVDYAIRSLDVDPERMLLAGFSYGGTMAFYASAHTDRFKAIFAAEGIVDALGRIAQNDAFMPNIRQRTLFGVSNIYDPAEQRVMSEQSPLKYVATVKTPLLIECGSSALAPADCIRYFRAIKEQTSTPTELIVYPRTGHGVFEPALRYDSAKRQVEWMDRYVTGRQ
jgi:dipeptidyl aminopeptidase/acylaminoacyl peptidase